VSYAIAPELFGGLLEVTGAGLVEGAPGAWTPLWRRFVGWARDEELWDLFGQPGVDIEGWSTRGRELFEAVSNAFE
jgi:hypothetical protein